MTDPVVVGLHDEKPDEPTGVGDAVWCRAECDECGKEGWTVEDALDDATGAFGGEARGLRCRECDETDRAKAREEYVGETIRVCHKKGRILWTVDERAYEVSIQLGGVHQNITVTEEFVVDQLE